jgi:hypothetical protein
METQEGCDGGCSRVEPDRRIAIGQGEQQAQCRWPDGPSQLPRGRIERHRTFQNAPRLAERGQDATEDALGILNWIWQSRRQQPLSRHRRG